MLSPMEMLQWKMPDSGPAGKLECFGGLNNKREFSKKVSLPSVIFAVLFSIPAASFQF